MITTYTEQQIFELALGYFRITFQTGAKPIDLSDRSFYGLLARSFARIFVLVQQQVLQTANDAIPAYQSDADGNLRSKTSREALDRWAFVFGLPSSTAGIYGSKGPTVSTGGIGTPTSSLPAVLIVAGTQLKDSTGAVLVETVANVTTDGPPNTKTVVLVSTTKGTQANLPAGTILSFVTPPVGIGSNLTLTTALSGATDNETDLELLQRLLRKIQNPQKGGTAADYRFWSENGADTATGEAFGIARGCVYPLRDGLGTVDVCALSSGSGLGRKPSAALITKLQDYLNSVRPVTAKVTAYAPEMASSSALRIRVRAQATSAKNNTFAYDWADGGTATIVTAHTANSITVAAVPAALSAAFAAGLKPRIQVIISTAGASPIPFVSRVTNIAGLVITLETNFVVQPTDAVDYFFAGGSIVVPIAERIRSHIDSLGPSRASGTADPEDPWEDALRRERIVDIVMETKDIDGTRMVLSMQPFATAVETALGAGFFASVDRSPRDIRAGVGPELLFVREGGIEVVG